MDPHKQKQMVSQLFENTSKSQDELDKMTSEEKREYLRGRLKQRMFFNGVSRQSSQQKKKMQEKMEESTKQPGEEEDTGVILSNLGFGAPSRIRTYDRILKRDLLYQLSYGRNRGTVK